MRALSAREVVDVWEAGAGQHPVDRALTLLAAARPGIPRRELASLSVGQRDASLLALRERTFGPRLPGGASCPLCDERLEFELDADEIRVPGADTSTGVLTLTDGEYELSFRLPNSWDLAEVALSEDPERGRVVLVERCMLGCARGDEPVEPRSLPESVLLALSEALESRNAQADVRLEMTCPACGHGWQAVLDIEGYLWSEIQARARRLLGEVHVLAKAYGWSEADILSLSAARRRLYLDWSLS